MDPLWLLPPITTTIVQRNNFLMSLCLSYDIFNVVVVSHIFNVVVVSLVVHTQCCIIVVMTCILLILV